ncbi:hypothetical protein A7U60_g2932 [Sanghuangporus baumii]|uniref:Uncharacterized protein n=1 Tax=Sanghuangporus baumii TaxID=108892 RepID=A0A9Q5I1F1_SANBA|nr:hypothetical protein A7U60_g2932 [Sanghuangporus baumii]
MMVPFLRSTVSSSSSLLAYFPLNCDQTLRTRNELVRRATSSSSPGSRGASKLKAGDTEEDDTDATEKLRKPGTGADGARDTLHSLLEKEYSNDGRTVAVREERQKVS